MPQKPNLAKVIDENEECLDTCLQAAQVGSGICLFYRCIDGEDVLIPIFSGNEGLYEGRAMNGHTFRYGPKEVQLAARMAHAKSEGHTLH